MMLQFQSFDQFSFNSSLCPRCLTEHPANAPHNLESLYYRCTFYGRYRRWPTWQDAVADCFAYNRDRSPGQLQYFKTDQLEPFNPPVLLN